MENLEQLKADIKREVKDELRKEFKSKMNIAIIVLAIYAVIVWIS